MAEHELLSAISVMLDEKLYIDTPLQYKNRPYFSNSEYMICFYTQNITLYEGEQ